MNQPRFSLLDLEQQAIHHEEVASAFRLVISSIRITDSAYELQVEAMNELEQNQFQGSSEEIKTKKPRWSQTARGKKKISRAMKLMWKKRRANK